MKFVTAACTLLAPFCVGASGHGESRKGHASCPPNSGSIALQLRYGAASFGGWFPLSLKLLAFLFR